MQRAICWATKLAMLCVVALAAETAQADIIFSQNFESGLGPGESTGGAFTINSTGHNNNGTMMMGHAAPYSNKEYSYYEISGLDLSGYTDILLCFDYEICVEQYYDRFNVQVSTSPIDPPGDLLNPTADSDMQYITGNFKEPHLGNVFFDGSSLAGPGSGLAIFDLSAFADQVVNLRFQFGSDKTITNPGVNLDNLFIKGTPTMPIPEPASLALWGVGAAIMAAGVARRRKRSASEG